MRGVTLLLLKEHVKLLVRGQCVVINNINNKLKHIKETSATQRSSFKDTSTQMLKRKQTLLLF